MSASMLAQKAKQFDDGLYAAVELAAQEGTDDFAGKKALLKRLAAELAENPAGQPGDVVLAAAELGCDPQKFMQPSLPSHIHGVIHSVQGAPQP